MPSVVNTTNPELEERSRNGNSAQIDDGPPFRTSAAEILSNRSERPEGIHGNTLDVIEGQDGLDTSPTIARRPNAAPSAISPDNGESEDEPGAFDDSHLQVDQPKKKKKKRSKKPKSKRGLVIHRFPGGSLLT
jgi:hypothetical protein